MDTNTNFNAKPIDSRIAASAITFKKIIIRLVDIPIYPAPAKEINLGVSQEVRLFSDFPVDIQIGDSPLVEKLRTEVFFKGNISKIKVRLRKAGAIGVLVLYVGNPYLGIDWQRESPYDKGLIDISQNINMPIAVGVQEGITNLSGTYLAFDDTMYGQEAFYVRSITYKRQLGTIDLLEFMETETGASQTLYHQAFRNPTSIDTVIYSPYLRISTKGEFHFYGSQENIDTALYLKINGVFI